VCEDEPDVEVDIRSCKKRKHSFWLDPVGDLISYAYEPWLWVDKFVAIAHNARAFNLVFVINRPVHKNSRPVLLTMNGQNIMCLKVENVTWQDSLNYLAMPLRKIPKAFGLTVVKSWYTNLFNTIDNFNYVGPSPDVSNYGVEQMHETERREFLTWYETLAKEEVFDNRRVLESYCQADMTVLREAGRRFANTSFRSETSTSFSRP
jgi:hypothetical protein